jgi:hypothetical protein
LEKENKKINELLTTQSERMTALRNVKRQLEVKSEDIRKKCEELAYLQKRCAELEKKCQEQGRLLEVSKIDKGKFGSSPRIEDELE